MVPPKDLETALSLRRTKEIELYPLINTLLDSIERNSIWSKRSRSSGLTLLEQQVKYDGRYNSETIFLPIIENRIESTFRNYLTV